MSLSKPTAGQALDTYRKTDAVFIVCQKNAEKMVEIAALNEEASQVTGYTNADLVGQPLDKILPDRIRDAIKDYVEFQDDQNDLLAVLTKQRDFAIKTREGNERPFTLRIIRGEAIDRNPWFHMVLVDEEKQRKSNAFRLMLKENFKGHEVMDERTGFPNRASVLKDLELLIYYTRNKEITASFAIIDINNFDTLQAQYGQKACERLHQHIASICKQKLRAEDTVGTLSDRAIAILLVDAAQQPAQMVLNRLRWMISVTPFLVNAKDELLAPVNISFTQIDGKISHTEVLERTEEFMREHRGKAVNSIQLVVTHERRERADRRKQSIPVAVDRRKGERRKETGGE
jgi:diguanylate cyclase (GGDEF)-like protein